MTSEEFIYLCQVSGYASKRNAVKYATGKDEFTEKDIEEIHRINERRLDINNGILDLNYCHCSGDGLIDMLADEPTPWNHTFDASRGVKKN